MGSIKLTYKIGDIEINRLGYGTMQLTGKGVFGEVEDRKNAKKYFRLPFQLVSTLSILRRHTVLN